jgi:hypothetical protein
VSKIAAGTDGTTAASIGNRLVLRPRRLDRWLLSEGYYVVGFDIERHVYGEHRYPAQLVLQDVLTLHGSQFKDAALDRGEPAVPGVQLPRNAVEASEGAPAAG